MKSSSSQVIRSRGKCDHHPACPDSRWDNPPALTTSLNMWLPAAHPAVNTSIQMWGQRSGHWPRSGRFLRLLLCKMLNTVPGRPGTWEPGIIICPPQTHTDLKWINFILWALGAFIGTNISSCLSWKLIRMNTWHVGCKGASGMIYNQHSLRSCLQRQSNAGNLLEAKNGVSSEMPYWSSSHCWPR